LDYLTIIEDKRSKKDYAGPVMVVRKTTQ